MIYEQAPQGKDPELWDIAKRRASFRSHLSTYLVVIIFLWVLWYINGAHVFVRQGLPWPIWPTLGWGIGLFFHYRGAYGSYGNQSIEKEYQKLQQQKSKTV